MRQHLALPRSNKCCPLSYKDIQLHFMTKEAYLCSNPNYGKATTSIEPLLLLWGAGFPATIPVISLMFTVRSAKNYFPLISTRSATSSLPFILQKAVPLYIRRRSCAPSSSLPCFSTGLMQKPVGLHGSGMFSPIPFPLPACVGFPLLRISRLLALIMIL